MYRNCTSTAIYQLNTVKQHHTSTPTSILTTKTTYCSLSAQRLSERTVVQLGTDRNLVSVTCYQFQGGYVLRSRC
jgi:hypothetical protein